MADTLTYAPRVKWHRRWTSRVLLILPALVTAYGLAVPQWKAYREHMIRRTAVREEIATNLAAARQAFTKGDVDATAQALFAAEFPRHLDRDVLRASEASDIDRQIEGIRRPLIATTAVQLIKQLLDDIERATDKYDGPPNPSEIRHHVECYTSRNEGCARRNTIQTQAIRAAAAIKAGARRQALGICEQIIDLQPAYDFDETFWASAGKP